jgi:hypothetical protein
MVSSFGKRFNTAGEHTFGTRESFETCRNLFFPCNTLPEREHTENHQNRNETKEGHDGLRDDKREGLPGSMLGTRYRLMNNLQEK